MVFPPPLNLYKNPALAMRHNLFCSFMMGGKINVTAFGFVLLNSQKIEKETLEASTCVRLMK